MYGVYVYAFNRCDNPICLVKEDGEHLMIPDDVEDDNPQVYFIPLISCILLLLSIICFRTFSLINLLSGIFKNWR